MSHSLVVTVLPLEGEWKQYQEATTAVSCFMFLTGSDKTYTTMLSFIAFQFS